MFAVSSPNIELYPSKSLDIRNSFHSLTVDDLRSYIESPASQSGGDRSVESTVYVVSLLSSYKTASLRIIQQIQIVAFCPAPVQAAM